jgi:PIN domain
VFTALLDACVLWPGLQRQFLLSLAIEGMYRPIWSAAILEEVIDFEVIKGLSRGLSEQEARRRADHLIAEMGRHFDDAEVTGWEPLEGSYGLPDPDDEHVVAAAVVGGAGAIVTNNLRHFPSLRLPFGLDVIHPADFACNTVELDPTTALRAIHEISGRTGKKGPKLSVAYILNHLATKNNMGEAVEMLVEAGRNP